MNGRLPDDFRKRTKTYAAEVIRLYVKLPKTREEIRVIGKQLLRSGTSVAAHVREASRARSDDEFISKLGGALQETDESALWLELLREECGTASQLTQPLEFESNELLAIFTDIRYAMRLTREETKAISEEVRRVDATAQIYLYGSRADDTARGGDIDLLVVSEQLDFRAILRLRTAILDRIGW